MNICWPMWPSSSDRAASRQTQVRSANRSRRLKRGATISGHAPDLPRAAARQFMVLPSSVYTAPVFTPTNWRVATVKTAISAAINAYLRPELWANSSPT